MNLLSLYTSQTYKTAMSQYIHTIYIHFPGNKVQIKIKKIHNLHYTYLTYTLFIPQ